MAAPSWWRLLPLARATPVSIFNPAGGACVAAPSTATATMVTAAVGFVRSARSKLAASHPRQTLLGVAADVGDRMAARARVMSEVCLRQLAHDAGDTLPRP
jgi:hypothetical protein